MRISDLRALAERDWQTLAQLKAVHWNRVRKVSGAARAIQAGEALRRHARRLHPNWPTRKGRLDDLKTHARVAASLRRLAIGHTR